MRHFFDPLDDVCGPKVCKESVQFIGDSDVIASKASLYAHCVVDIELTGSLQSDVFIVGGGMWDVDALVRPESQRLPCMELFGA